MKNEISIFSNIRATFALIAFVAIAFGIGLFGMANTALADTIFSDGFEDASIDSGWNATHPGSVSISTVAPQSGSQHLRFVDATSTNQFSRVIDTSGYENVEVCFYWQHLLTSQSTNASYSYSTDGGTTWSTANALLSFGGSADPTSSIYSDNGQPCWNLSGIPAADDNPNFAFQIKTTFFGDSSEYIDLDNFTVTGDQIVVGTAPAFQGTSLVFHVDEGTTASIVDLNATDADAGDTLTYSITTARDDEGDFSIDSSTGVVSFLSAPDYENPTDADTNNEYEIEAKVDDGTGNSTTTNINVIVEGIDDETNDKPMINNGVTSLFLSSVSENTTGVIHTADFATYDSGESYSFTLSGDDAGDFNITTTGELSFVTAPDFENPTDADTDNRYLFMITLSDGTNSDVAEVYLDVQDVTGEGADTTDPVISNFSVTAGDVLSGTVNLTVDVTDADSGVDTVSFVRNDGVGGPSKLSASFVSGNKWDRNINTTAYPDGSYDFWVEAKDVAGNSVATSPLSITIDNNAGSGSSGSSTSGGGGALDPVDMDDSKDNDSDEDQDETTELDINGDGNQDILIAGDVSLSEMTDQEMISALTAAVTSLTETYINLDSETQALVSDEMSAILSMTIGILQKTSATDYNSTRSNRNAG